MTAALREQHKNQASTTLNGSITNSDNPITVTDGSVFPSTGNFRVMIDTEILICTARSSNSLTVSRGQDGTSAASHSSGATISMIYSTQGLSNLFLNADALHGYSSRKPTQGLWADDGKTIITTSDFTWQNQGGAAVSDEAGTIVMTCPTDAGRNLRVQERSAPSTPYSYIGAFSVNVGMLDTDAKPAFGMGFRESSSSKLMLGSFMVESFFGWRPTVNISRFSNTSTLFTTNFGGHIIMFRGELLWMKIENDGTNLKWSLSNDGTEWLTYFSESKTAYLSGNPDKVLWFGSEHLNSVSPATSAVVRLHHWSKGE
jgi:hypothetical protein